jgi:cytochrome P450
MFGRDLAAVEQQRVTEVLAPILTFMMRGMVTHSLPEWIPVPGRARYREAIRTIDEIVFRVIDRGRHGAHGENNLLSLRLELVDGESGERMTDVQLRDEAVALFVAGYETTAVAIAWAFHLLTQHPELARRLREEVDGVLGQGAPGFADLPQLVFSRNVLQEALRLYSPTYWLPRTALEDDEIDGYRIPAGRMVAIFSHLIHHNPEVWEAPHTFDPDRFTPERSRDRHKLAWIPFGAGQRVCMGREFAMMEGLFIFARVTQRYRVEALPGQVACAEAQLTLHPKGGVRVRLAAR